MAGALVADGRGIRWEFNIEEDLLYLELSHGLLLAAKSPHNHGDLLPKQLVFIVNHPLLFLHCLLQSLQALQYDLGHVGLHTAGPSIFPRGEAWI